MLKSKKPRLAAFGIEKAQEKQHTLVKVRTGLWTCSLCRFRGNLRAWEIRCGLAVCVSLETQFVQFGATSLAADHVIFDSVHLPNALFELKGFTWCIKCGAGSCSRRQRLNKPCGELTLAGVGMLSRIWRGKDPYIYIGQRPDP